MSFKPQNLMTPKPTLKTPLALLGTKTVDYPISLGYTYQQHKSEAGKDSSAQQDRGAQQDSR